MESIALVLEGWKRRDSARNAAQHAACIIMWACNSNGRSQLAIVHAFEGTLVRGLLDIVGNVVPGDQQQAAAKSTAAGPRKNTSIALYAKTTSKIASVAEFLAEPQLPPESPRFVRGSWARVRLLIIASEKAPGERVLVATEDWTVYQGSNGARAFVEEGFKNEDVILLWPGTHTAETWGLDKIFVESCLSATIEVVGVGRRGAVQICNKNDEAYCLVVGAAEMKSNQSLAYHIANLTVTACTYEGALRAGGESRSIYVEVDRCDIVAGENLRNYGGSGIEIYRGVSHITDCRVSMAAASGITLRFNHVLPGDFDVCRRGQPAYRM